jgi:hypothetical protein
MQQLKTTIMKQLVFNLYDLHTAHLNETDQDILLAGDSYYNGERVELMVVFKDIDFLEFISHHEIDRIKENLKKRIDEL